LENLGRDLPEYQRVHDFVLRAEPLPRTTTRKLRRFELAGQLAALRQQSDGQGTVKALEISETDQVFMNSQGGRATIAAMKQHMAESEVIHPRMNLEIDLGLDSLARAECFVSVEQSLGIQLEPDEAANVQTVGDLVRLANAKLGTGPASARFGYANFSWREALAQPALQQELPEEVRVLLKPKPGSVVLAYAVLRVIYLIARLLFRMEVKGADVLTKIEPPYLICPNHQSYLDPFVVCSTYSRRVLREVFHVGASMYFSNAVMALLARLINVVPIDPDRHLLRAMRAGVAGLSAQKILTIYPEGQRSFDGKLHEFKKGAAILATEMKVPIIPVALDGAYLIWPRYSGRFHFAKIRIFFGNPIDPQEVAAGSTGEAAYEKLTEVLQHRIQQMLNDMRGTKNDSMSIKSEQLRA
jgi:long-chain acyl-CoA synthetase